VYFFKKKEESPALTPLTPSFYPAPCGIPQAITFPIQSPSSTPVVFSRVLYGERHKHNNHLGSPQKPSTCAVSHGESEHIRVLPTKKLFLAHVRG